MGKFGIPTEYNGCEFRSRLEARFFEALNLPYQYEHKTYKIGNGQIYTPDFYLPEQKAILEIKPKQEYPNLEASYKLETIALQEPNKKFYLIYGTPKPFLDVFYTEEPFIQTYQKCHHETAQSPKIYSDEYFAFCECPVCQKIGIEYAGFYERICRHKNYYSKLRETATVQRIQDAYKKAYSYRF
jgi:hypothetical protein